MCNFDDFVADFEKHQAALLIEPEESGFQTICEMLEGAGWRPWTDRYGKTVAEYAKNAYERGFDLLTASKSHAWCVTGSKTHEGDIYDVEALLANSTIGEEAFSLLF